MHNPPLKLLQAIQKALSNQQPAGSPSGTHIGLFHDGATGTLYPPIIPALNHEGGVGKTRWDIGVVDVIIPMYSFYAVGDDVVLYVDDQYVDHQTVTDTNQSLVFHAPVNAFSPSPLAPEYQADVHFHTIDNVGQNETASRSTLLPVKLTVPGNPRDDLPPGAQVNENLAKAVGVPGQITPVPGVHLPVVIQRYEHMAAGDVITLFWEGVAIPLPPLTAEQVDLSVTVEVPDTIIAARPGAAREVRYSIRDRVQNYSLFSPSVYTDVAEQATLAPPLLIGQVGEQFDPDTLAGAPALITVPDTDLRLDDKVTLYFTGQPLDWPYLHHVTEEQPFIGTSLMFTVPNPLARSLAGSSLNLYYQVQRGGNLLRSHNSDVRIVGTPLVLPPPVIPIATGGELAPPAGAINVEIIVPANIAFAPRCEVQLRWLGVDGAGDDRLHTLTHPIESPGLNMTFRAPIAWANEIAGGTLEVSYSLLAGGQAYGSDVLQLAVAGEAGLLPVPRFDPALSTNDELDLDSLAVPFHVLVDVSNTNFVGGTATLSWIGSTAGDELVSDPIPANSPPLRFPIDRSRLIEPNLDQNVAIHYQIRRPDGRIARSRIMTLAVISSATRPWPAVQVMDATNEFVGRLEPQLERAPGVWEENTATLVIIDPRLHLGDLIIATWMRGNGAVSTLAPQETSNGQVRISVPSDVLAASVIRDSGTRVKITYHAVVSGIPAPPSQDRILEIAQFRLGSLPKPVILEANESTLALNSFSGTATARIGKYPFMKVGQTFWLVLSGTLDPTGNSTIRLGTAPFAVTAADMEAGRIDRTIERADLLRLKDQTDLRLDAKVGLSSSPNESDAFVLDSTTYTLRQVQLDLPAPIVEGLDADNTLLIRQLTGTTKITTPFTSEAGQTVEVVWASPAGAPAYFLFPSPPRLMPGSQEFLIPNNEVARSHGMRVPVAYQVRRTEGAVAIVSPAVNVNVIVELDIETEDFSTETPRLIPAGVPEPLRFFTITFWGPYGHIQENDMESSVLRGRVIRAEPNGGCTLTPFRPAKQIIIDGDTSEPSVVVAQIYFEDGTWRSNITLSGNRIVYSDYPDSPSPRRIAYVVISATTYYALYIDNVQLNHI